MSVSGTRVVEAAKILENFYRAVSIALVNELKVTFDRMGIDVWEVIEVAKTKPFGFQALYPGPGLSGRCIPIDPFHLTRKARAARGDDDRAIRRPRAGDRPLGLRLCGDLRVREARHRQPKRLRPARPRRPHCREGVSG